MAQGNYGSTGDFKGKKGKNAADGKLKPTPKGQKKESDKKQLAVFSTRKSGGKFAGRVKISRSVSLAEAASGDAKAINTRITRKSDDFSPSERAEKRKADRDKGPQLGKRLAAIAAGISPGRSKIGAAISGGVSGAAIGATIGEELDANKLRRRKRAAKKKSEKDA